MIKIPEHVGCIIHNNTPVLPCPLEHALHFTRLGFHIMVFNFKSIILQSKLENDWNLQAGNTLCYDCWKMIRIPRRHSLHFFKFLSKTKLFQFSLKRCCFDNGPGWLSQPTTWAGSDNYGFNKARREIFFINCHQKHSQIPLMKNKRGAEPCESFLSQNKKNKKFKLFFFVFAASICLVLTSLLSNPCALNYIINFNLLSVNRSVILMRKLFFFL